jgi:hypothetical protein
VTAVNTVASGIGTLFAFVTWKAWYECASVRTLAAAPMSSDAFAHSVLDTYDTGDLRSFATGQIHVCWLVGLGTIGMANILAFAGSGRVIVDSLTTGSAQQAVLVGPAGPIGQLAGQMGSTIDVALAPNQTWTLKAQHRLANGSWEDGQIRLGNKTTIGGVPVQFVECERDLTGGDFRDMVLRVQHATAVGSSPPASPPASPPTSPPGTASGVFVDSEPFDLPQWSRGIEIRAQLKDPFGQPVVLRRPGVALTVRFSLAWVDVVPAVVIRGVENPGVARIVDADNGMVAYVFQPGDLDRTGGYRGEFWLESNPERFSFPVRAKLRLRVWKTLERL